MDVAREGVHQELELRLVVGVAAEPAAGQESFSDRGEETHVARQRRRLVQRVHHLFILDDAVHDGEFRPQERLPAELRVFRQVLEIHRLVQLQHVRRVAEQVVAADVVVVRRLHEEREPRLPDAVLVVGQQRLRDAEVRGRLLLADALPLPLSGEPV